MRKWFNLNESRSEEGRTAGDQFCNVNGNAVRQAIEWGKTKPTILSRTFDGLVFDYCKGKVGTFAGYIGDDNVALYINFDVRTQEVSYDVALNQGQYL